jgi:uncharacterized membrane protein
MSTVTVTRVMDAPVDEVWRIVTGLPGRCDWLHTVNQVDLLTTGPFGAGTAWRETRTMPDGSEVAEEFRVIDSRPIECFVLESPGIGADYRMTYSFASIDSGRHVGGTEVTVVQEGAPTAPGGRFIALVLGGLAARTVEGSLRADLDDLAAAAERPADGEAAA